MKTLHFLHCFFTTLQSIRGDTQAIATQLVCAYYLLGALRFERNACAHPVEENAAAAHFQSFTAGIGKDFDYNTRAFLIFRQHACLS